MTLTANRRRFVEEYFVDGDRVAAYVRAGYKVLPEAAAAKAEQLFALPIIQQAITDARAGGKQLGRPTSYSERIADLICDGLAEPRSLRSICLDDGMPSQSTVFRWLADDRYADFRERYARAREAQAEALFDEIIDIADDGTNDWVQRERDDGSTYDAFNAEHVQRSKLRIDSRKWMAGKLAPKKYGDAATVKLADADGESLPMGDVERATRLAAIFAQIEARRGSDDAD